MPADSNNLPTSDGRPVDTKRLICQGRLRFQILVNLLRLAFELRIERARNDAFVLLPLTVQADAVLAVQRQDGPSVAAGLLQNLHVSHSLFGSAHLLNRHHLKNSNSSLSSLWKLKFQRLSMNRRSFNPRSRISSGPHFSFRNTSISE